MAGYRKIASVRSARLSSLCQIRPAVPTADPCTLSFFPLVHVSSLHGRYERSNGRLIVLRAISDRKQTESERERLKE
jgi:hypothetical protein